jgi:hypothetical protein
MMAWSLCTDTNHAHGVEFDGITRTLCFDPGGMRGIGSIDPVPGFIAQAGQSDPLWKRPAPA